MKAIFTKRRRLTVKRTTRRLLLLLAISRRRRAHGTKKRIRSVYIRPMFQRRTYLGEFNLLEDLKNDPEYHHKYFRWASCVIFIFTDTSRTTMLIIHINFQVNKETFQELYLIVKPQIEHTRNHAYPIPPLMRFAITLRFEFRFVSTGSDLRGMQVPYWCDLSSMMTCSREYKS